MSKIKKKGKHGEREREREGKIVCVRECENGRVIKTEIKILIISKHKHDIVTKTNDKIKKVIEIFNKKNKK